MPCAQGAAADAVNTAAQLRIAADRRVGQELVQMEKNVGGRPSETDDSVSLVCRPTLAQLGIGGKQSERWQALARRGMVAARLATLRQAARTDLASIAAARSQPDSATLLNVSRSAVQRPRVAQLGRAGHMLISIDTITITPGHRRINPAKVKELVVSIQTIGLRTPITVQHDPNNPGSFILVAGRHRVEACRKLGETEIEAVLAGDDKLDAGLWETAENLHRAELTAVQRTVAEAEWIKLAARKVKRDQKDRVRHRGANESRREDGRGHRQEGGVRAAARAIGMSETSGRRAIYIAENLTAAARKEAERLGLDNSPRALEAASKVGGGEEQIRALHRFIKRKRDKEAERNADKERKAQREAMPSPAPAAVPASPTAAPAPKTAKEAFDRWYWSLEIDMRTEVLIWLLGLDIEAYVDEFKKAAELIRKDRAALH